MPWREIDGRAVIVQPRTGAVHELNAVGTFLWKQADGRRSLDELALAVSDTFEVEPASARADAAEFFRSLADQGLLAAASES